MQLVPSLSPPRIASTLALALWLGTGVAAPAAWAADDEAHIDYRQKLMTNVGSHLGAISDILKHGLPFTAHVEAHARGLAQDAKLVSAAFEKKVVAGPTDAEPEIWTDWTRFEAANADFLAAAEALEETARTGDLEAIAAKTKAVGKSCGGCHKSFRKPKEESYKRK